MSKYSDMPDDYLRQYLCADAQKIPRCHGAVPLKGGFFWQGRKN